MSKAPDLLEASIAFMEEIQRQLDGWQSDSWEPDYPGELPPPMKDGEREGRISQLLTVLNSCEGGDMRRAISRAKWHASRNKAA